VSKRITGEGPNPSGLCMCGCGRQTLLANASDRRRGHVKDRPLRYIYGHNARIQLENRPEGSNPSGLCQCGCGQRTQLARQTRCDRGDIQGLPVRYIYGHKAWPRLPVEYIVDKNGCWVWQGVLTRKGYGMKRDAQQAGKKRPAHAIYWELANGVEVPRGLQIDHLCRNKACVNPAHLEPVTASENKRRDWAAREVAMMNNLLLADLMAGESYRPGWCICCGDHPVQGHHIVRRSQGGTNGPVIDLCIKHHNAVHAYRLHFHFEDGWKYLETSVPTKYETTLDMSGWKRIR
jgi:hypothetical protein